MQLGTIGGRLLGGGLAVLAAGYALMVLAVPFGNAVAGLGAAVVASGAAALCASPRPPFTGKVARFGLGVLAMGLACLLVSAIVAAGLTFDPLESWPVVLFGLAGLVLTPVGLLVTLASLIRRFATSRS